MSTNTSTKQLGPLKRPADDQIVTTPAAKRVKAQENLFGHLPAEMRNEIFILKVVHRDQKTGKQCNVHLRHSFGALSNLAYINLSKAYPQYEDTLRKLFFGQNNFEMKPILEIVVSPRVSELERPSHCLDSLAASYDMEVARALPCPPQNYDARHIGHVRQAMLVPGQKQRELIKNLTFSFSILHWCKKMKDRVKGQAEIFEQCRNWFAIIHHLNWLGDLNLESITIALNLERDGKTSRPDHWTRACSTDEAKVAIQAYVDAIFARVKSKKKEIKWPAEWSMS